MTRMATAPSSLRRVTSASVPRPVSDARPATVREACMRTQAGAERYPFFPARTPRRRSDRPPVSGQFIMCTSCHELLDSSGTRTNPSSGHLTTTPTGTQYTITDTHFATPGNWPAAPVQTRYRLTATPWILRSRRSVRPATIRTSQRPRTGNGHSRHMRIRILINLNSTTHATGYFSGAWAHYNWSLASPRGMPALPYHDGFRGLCRRPAYRQYCRSRSH